MDPDAQKRAAAARAIEFVRPGMRLGLGTGSTAQSISSSCSGERVRDGLEVVGVPTSDATRRDAERVGVPLSTLDETPELDLTVDGADEIAPDLSLIKGGGGALLREKIVAAASARMIVIADESKWVPVLGRFPLPVEVEPFGLESTRRAVEAAYADSRLARRRRSCGGPRTATLSSRMAGTGFSTERCSGSPIRRRWRRGCPPFRASSSTDCSLGLRPSPFSPEARASAWSSDPEKHSSTGEEHRHVCQDQCRRRYGRSRARGVPCARIDRGGGAGACAAEEPSPAAIKLAREILDLKNTADLFEPLVPAVVDRVRGMLAADQSDAPQGSGGRRGESAQGRSRRERPSC